MWAEIRPMSEKQKKYIAWQNRMAAAKERGRIRYAENKKASWSEKDQENFRKLSLVQKFSVWLQSSPSATKELKKEFKKVSWVLNMINNVNQWGKPLSEKQMVYVEKAFAFVEKYPESVV